MLNKGLELSVRETRLDIGQSLKQFCKNTLGIADIHNGILTTDDFLNHRYQVVRNFRRSRKHGSHLPLPGVAFQDIGNAQKTFCVCY
ncbi:hypothetical protein D3C87_2066210 [compost metagenome]